LAIVVVVMAGRVVDVVDVVEVVVGATVVVVAGIVVLVVAATVDVVSALLLSSLQPAPTSAAMQTSPRSVRRAVMAKVCQHN
jgi:hypothetical protein